MPLHDVGANMRILILLFSAMALAGCDQQPPASRPSNEQSAAPMPKHQRAITASFDCDRARGQAQELICGDASLAAMDREVARLAALAVDPASQSDWQQQRDRCDKADELRQCVMASAMLKIHQLRKVSKTVPGGEGPSIGPVAFTCGGLAGSINATFFNSNPGAVAIEWGGQAIAIDQAMSGSGARYEGRWEGQPYVFWNKGRQATFTVPGKGDLQCVEASPSG